jgi:hypothetical protein
MLRRVKFGTDYLHQENVIRIYTVKPSREVRVLQWGQVEIRTISQRLRSGMTASLPRLRAQFQGFGPETGPTCGLPRP